MSTRENEKAPQGQRACISTVCHFLLEQKKQGGHWYIKKKKKERENEREAIVMVGSFAVRSLGAEGELLQVMDALLVNQTDGKGGEIQDEAFVEL